MNTSEWERSYLLGRMGYLLTSIVEETHPDTRDRLIQQSRGVVQDYKAYLDRLAATTRLPH
jgi:hypothetical protein